MSVVTKIHVPDATLVYYTPLPLRAKPARPQTALDQMYQYFDQD